MTAPPWKIFSDAYPGWSKKLLLGEMQMKVQSKLSHHPVLRLENDPKQNAKVWKSLPPVQGVNIGLVPAKGSHVLSTTRKNKANHPVLVTRQVKEGRTMAIATDSSWNWNFLRVGDGGSGRYYQKFWENVIAWMTGEPETNPIQVETDKEKYREHEKVVIHFKVSGQDYNPLPGVEVDLVLNSLPKKQELVRETVKTDEHGEGRFEFSPGREGFYSAKVMLTSGREVLSGRNPFHCVQPADRISKTIGERNASANLVESDRRQLSRIGSRGKDKKTGVSQSGSGNQIQFANGFVVEQLVDVWIDRRVPCSGVVYTPQIRPQLVPLIHF